MADVNESVCTERHKAIDERFNRDEKQIEKQEDKSEQLATLSIQLGEMLKNHNEKLENHDQRIGVLESKPGKRWDIIVNAALQWIVVAVLAAVVVFK